MAYPFRHPMIAKAIEAVQSDMTIARKDIFVLISSIPVIILGSVISSLHTTMQQGGQGRRERREWLRLKGL